MTEIVLKDIIERRLKLLKETPDIVDRIFPQTTMTIRSRLKGVLSQGLIKVLNGFPVDGAVLPCYVIMLGSEMEQTQAIGNIFEEEDTFELGSRTDTVRPKLKAGRVIIEIEKKPLHIVESVTVDGEPYENFEIINHRLGAIQLYDEIGYFDNREVTISYSYKSAGFDARGSFFDTNYRVETWTTNGDLTVYLYHLLKWILLTSRDELAVNTGLVVQSLGGMDFEPAPEYFPEFVYRRALTFSSSVLNEFAEVSEYIQKVVVNGEVEDNG